MLFFFQCNNVLGAHDLSLEILTIVTYHKNEFPLVELAFILQEFYMV